MPILRSITSGLRSLFKKGQVERELDEELNGFLEAPRVSIQSSLCDTSRFIACLLPHCKVTSHGSWMRKATWLDGL